MKKQWQELKETIIELRDSDGTLTQQEVCQFWVRYMEVLETKVVADNNEHVIQYPKGEKP